MSEPIATIRRATAADCTTLTALMHGSSAYRGTYREILRGYAITPLQVDRDTVHLAETAGGVAGFYSLANLSSEPELDLLFVADAAQRSGIGTRLFRHMQEVARSHGARDVRIVSHPPAESFYLRMGAVRVGVKEPSGRVSWSRPVLVLSIPHT